MKIEAFNEHSHHDHHKMLIIKCNWYSCTISTTEISHLKKKLLHLTIYVTTFFTISYYTKNYVHVSELHL